MPPHFSESAQPLSGCRPGRHEPPVLSGLGGAGGVRRRECPLHSRLRQDAFWRSSARPWGSLTISRNRDRPVADEDLCNPCAPV